MALFMVQATYTSEAWTALIANPQDRRRAIGGLVAKAGGKMIDLYFALGENDIVFIFEAPDAVTAASVSVAGYVAGHIKTIKTTQLLTVDESLELMRRAAALGPGPAPAG